MSQDALLAYNLSFEEVAAKVRNSNLLSTGGTIKTDAEDYLIRADNRSYYADKLNDVIVKSTPSGSSILLSDVAKVRDQFEETPNALFYNGDSAVTMVISNTNSEDLISSADAIKEYIANFNAKNNNVQLNVASDSSITLNQRTKLLIENGAVGILLVLIFLSIFLNIRLALWVSVGLPLSFLFANAFGVTINVLSLFGMIIVIGILVDDGIVIAENIYQQYEKGKSPIRAAIDGAVEVIPPIISAIITTILAFSTFFFLEGRIGEFFSEVSIIVLLTLSISLIEAFLILPAHIAHSKAIRPKKKKAKKRTLLGRFFAKMRHVNAFGDRVMRYLRDNSYAPVLRFVINNRLFSMAILIAALALTIGSVGGGIIRVTFFPSVASDRVEVSLLMTEGVNPQKTDSIISIVEEAAWRVIKLLPKSRLIIFKL